MNQRFTKSGIFSHQNGKRFLNMESLLDVVAIA
jgi:hypothetical protein